MENALDNLLNRIRAFRRQRGWSINQLAVASGLPWSVLGRMDDPSWSPSSNTLRALALVMEPPRPRRSKAIKEDRV